ncbi:MAG TPA: hypothetical protein DDX14_02600 [Cyanobacteria bacterium UBA9579]|nr:hypothetical protein [Cyanobacteria bacterium UBA9579]
MLINKTSGFQVVNPTNAQKKSLNPVSGYTKTSPHVSFGCAADGGIPEMTLFLATAAILRRVSPQKAEKLNKFVANHFNFKIKGHELPIGRKSAALERWQNEKIQAGIDKLKNFYQNNSFFSA